MSKKSQFLNLDADSNLNTLKINKDFAKKFEHRKKREHLDKF